MMPLTMLWATRMMKKRGECAACISYTLLCSSSRCTAWNYLVQNEELR